MKKWIIRDRTLVRSLILLLVVFCERPLANGSCKPVFTGEPIQWVQVSNGQLFPVPTRSEDIEIYAVLANLDLKATQEFLRPYGLFPAQLKGQAVAAIAVANYFQSDLGPFREFYFAILATQKATNAW